MIALLFIGLAVSSQPSTVRFQHISVEKGLSSSQITSITQDKNGFMWFGTWKGLNRYDGYEFKVFRHNPKDSTGLTEGGVYSLLTGRDGTVWVGTSTGLNRLDDATETFKHYIFENKDPATQGQRNQVLHLCEDLHGMIWVGCRYGLFRLDPVTEHITAFVNIPGDSTSLSGNLVRALCLASNGTLWIGTNNGLNRHDPSSDRFQHFMPALNTPTATTGKEVHNIKATGDGRLYILTDDGLGILHLGSSTPRFERGAGKYPLVLEDKIDGARWFLTANGLSRMFTDGRTEDFKYSPYNADGLNSSNIRCIFQDREGSIWIGTDNGLNLLTPDAFQFKHFKHQADDPNSLSHNVVLCVYEDRGGDIWLGTMGGGLNRLDLQSGHVQRYPFNDPDSPLSTGSGKIFRVIEDYAGTLWVGLMDRGLDRLDANTKTFSHHRWNDARDLVSFFYESKDNVLWIGHQGGVSRFNRETGSFDFAPYAPEEMKIRAALGVVTGIMEDHTGTWWVSSNRYYLNRFDPKTMQYRPYLPDPGNPASIRSDDIQAMYEDRKGRIWVAAYNGLDLFDRRTDTFVHYGLEHGLPDLVIGHMLEDGVGRLWLATGKGIARFDEQKQVFHTYDKMDGLASNESWDFIKSPSTGAFLLATANGLTIFHPDSLRSNELPPPVVFTKFTHYDNKLKQEVEEPGISGKTTITLSHDVNIFTFKFSALSYRKSPKNQYAYKLEGFSNNWFPLGTKREVTFTHLNPGTYTLRVIGSNGDGVWNNKGASLKFIILPPWNRIWWAYLLYVVLILSGLYYLYRFQLKRKLEHAENMRLIELDTFKTRLYTNITHEFRTPLTIISGMADQILEQPQRWLEEGVHAIKRSSVQLLRLVNQMLDLQKLEAGKMPVNMVQDDVLIFLKYLVESFESQARTKGVDLHFETAVPELVMDYDPDKLQQIISNLLSNALKFTPLGGKVRLKAGFRNLRGFGNLELQCTDTGIGISSEKQPFIFDRFYQADDSHKRLGEGTGIGLALTRELVKLLGGEISVKSEPDQGATFTVLLPVTHNAPFMAGSEETMPEKILPLTAATLASTRNENIVAEYEELPLALVIEDNADVQRYLSACLENAYQVAVAGNGREGIEKAIEYVPDIVISDVMMPEKDGFEVCQSLKDDIRTSHIPVILLTAKADAESRLHGLTCGADAYLAKPFDKKELLVRIQKLLELRRKLQEHYFTQGALGPQMGKAGTKEQVFVQKVREVVEEHLNDHQFSMEELSREMAMSRSQLHRKITALTGISPNRYTRHLRLQKARQLLVETDDNIAGIAYDTGFTDPSYFTRVFLHEFGMTPSEFRETHERNT